jgi:ATP-dependent Clp protease ATP-binding subunit ClpB
MHTTMGAGAGSKSNMDVASILKENLEHNGIKLIGATTTDEYQTYIETNQAFKRRFEKIMIKEPSKEVTEKIVRSKLDELSLVTKVKVDFNLQELAKTVETIVEVSDKNHRVYDDNANNPDLALTILKKAFAFTLANDHDKIEASDVEEAIKSCERINESYREETATKYGKEMTKLKNSPNKVKEKIINFPKSVN